MSAAILNQGRTSIRDALKTAFAPNIGVTDDQTAFSASQTALNPSGGTTSTLIKAATITDVDYATFKSEISIDGSSEFTGKVINTIGACLDTTAASAQSRSVRGSGLGIGVQAGDLFTIGLQIAVQDNS